MTNFEICGVALENKTFKSTTDFWKAQRKSKLSPEAFLNKELENQTLQNLRIKQDRKDSDLETLSRR